MEIKQVYQSDFPSNIYIDFFYTSKKYFKTKISMKKKTWNISFIEKEFKKKFVHKENVQFFSPYKENSEYYTVLTRDPDTNVTTQVAWMSIGKVEWKNTARLWDLFVSTPYLRQKIGSKLITLAEGRAKLWKCRALEIETQTSNINAIKFYLHHGYNLSGLDSICYTNNDLKRNEVRLELVKKFIYK